MSLRIELSDLCDRRWALRKDGDESESESGGENGEEEQKAVGSEHEEYQDAWQMEQEMWRKEAEEEDE